ncbi:hypothetical protein Tco_0116651 [Tanacetum coccineum]
MLRDGIDTWAPEHELEFKSTIVNSPAWDESNLMPMDALRRQFIIMSQMHMLEYVKSAATTSSAWTCNSKNRLDGVCDFFTTTRLKTASMSYLSELVD